MSEEKNRAADCSTEERIEKLAEGLADGYKFNWTDQGTSARDVADRVLVLMVNLGLIQHQKHRYGGDIWIVNGNRYGRTDD